MMNRNKCLHLIRIACITGLFFSFSNYIFAVTDKFYLLYGTLFLICAIGTFRKNKIFVAILFVKSIFNLADSIWNVLIPETVLYFVTSLIFFYGYRGISLYKKFTR
jgi:hypothetical protein